MHGMHAHFSRDWLIENGNLPEKAGNVEIYSIRDFVTWKQYQPAMLLHEMAHQIHYRKRAQYGPRIEAAFQAAKASGKYDLVQYIGGQELPAYAMSTAYEYFAESAESFFTSQRFWNDYYPFINSELQAFDHTAWSLVAEVFGVNGSKYLAQFQTPKDISMDPEIARF
mgnify:CR=1 FL=1